WFSPLPNFAISDALYESFEESDLRKASWIGKADMDEPVYFPFKYKETDPYSGNPFEDYMIFRLTEQYLIRAEALAHLDEPSDALADLNAIRLRAGLTELEFTDQETLLSDIMHERRIEFFCEGGNRWYD